MLRSHYFVLDTSVFKLTEDLLKADVKFAAMSPTLVQCSQRL